MSVYHHARRSTTTRDRHRAIIGRRKGPCGICGKPIDYSLPYLHPGSFVVDHITPLVHGGLDVLANKQAAHRKCNRDKGDKIEPDHPPIQPLTTTRKW